MSLSAVVKVSFFFFLLRYDTCKGFHNMATHRSSNLFLTLLSDCRVVPAVERAEFAKLACEEAVGVLMSGLWKPDTKTKFEISKFNMAIVDSRQRDDSTQYVHCI
jgi:hypothetical protein